jgi:RNA polymerase sigma-70 factor (ECF subfamily)
MGRAGSANSKGVRRKALKDGRNTTRRPSWALDELYGEHRQHVFDVCLAILKNPRDAEDATQETFTSWARKAPDPDRNVQAYLKTMARNICLDELRKRVRETVVLREVGCLQSVADVEGMAVARTRAALAWGQLSDRERAIAALAYHGYSLAQIGATLGLTGTAVSTGLCRLRKRARRVA